MSRDEELGAVFEEMEEDMPVSNVKDVVVPDGPDPTSPEWHDWVMSMFEDDETFEGYPVAAGLRRVTELIIGEIVESVPVNTWSTPPIQGLPGGATQWRVTIRLHHSGEIRVYGDVADCTAMNAEDDYLRFGLATSATRAEARALRKALKLKKCAAEELTNLDVTAVKEARSTSRYNKPSSGEHTSSTSSTEPSERQIGFLNSICQDLDVNVDKAFTLVKVHNKSHVTKANTSELLDTLKEMRNNPGTVPGDITGYENWSIN